MTGPMTPVTATLIAASLAALASMITLVVSVVSKAGEEARNVNRQLLTSDLKAFGRAIHEVIALSAIQVKRIGTDNFADRYQKAEAAAKRLKELRLDVRYSLWGMDSAIRTLGRLPDWIGHAKPYPSYATEILEAGSRLGKQLDLAVRTAYLQGRSPGLWRRLRVNSATRKLIRIYRSLPARQSLSENHSDDDT